MGLKPCLIYCLVSREHKNLLILDIDDQHATYVFIFKGTQAAYLNLNVQQHRDIQPIQKVYLKNKLILDRTIFDIISFKKEYVAQTCLCA